MNILLIEDEKGVAAFIKKGLEEEGYFLDLAITGEEGLSLARKKQYDLVVLDVMLPGIQGTEVCRRMRDAGIQFPVLMLTARDSVKDKVLGLDSGADDYLTKPFSFDEFVARVRALLRRKQDKLTELTYKELKIDLISHQVYVADVEVELRPKEYSLLLYLLQNRGTVVSRSRLLSDVWGYHFDPTTNLVDVHIRLLREKLAEHSKTEFIHSVRGIGYTVET